MHPALLELGWNADSGAIREQSSKTELC